MTSELTVVDEADFGAARPDAGWMGGQFILTYRTCCEVRAAAHPLSLRELHSESSSVCVCVCVGVCGQMEFTAGGAPREWGSAGATHEYGFACAAACSTPWGRRGSDVCGWLRLRGGAFDTVSPYSVAELRAIAKVSSRRARARASLCCACQRALCCHRRPLGAWFARGARCRWGGREAAND